MNPFKFELGQPVMLLLSGETGMVVGRAQYLDHANTYLVRYVDGTMCEVEKWWDQNALTLSLPTT